MDKLKLALMSLGLMCGVSTMSLAGEGNANIPPFPENGMVYIIPNGAVTSTALTQKGMDAMMTAGAMPMTAGTMMMMHGGKMYTLADHMMPDGKLMSAAMMADMTMHK